MQDLLFLAHRIPYPPDKGDKIRAWHFLEHLAGQYRVHLGCFVDDPRDWRFTDILRRLCGESCFVRLSPRLARLRSLGGLLDGRPLTLPYYFDRELQRWVNGVMERQQISRVFIYCSAMAQYVKPSREPSLRRIADMVDVDSQKWSDYARQSKLPKRWLYRREAATLRRVESRIAASFDATIVATSEELALLREFAPEARGRVVCIGNGVDGDYFSPDREYENPYHSGGTPIAFIGAMNYWPNVDAVAYFVRTILPLVRQRIADAQFFIVGSNPAPEVVGLASGSEIVVTGWVPDVRPYAAHARAIVAPLRIARGVQNKVLEGMAMSKPVIASSKALAGITADIDKDVFLADNPEEFAASIYRAAMTAAGPAIGRNARNRVMMDYRWSASLARLDAVLNA
jgi:sugar transferase (PEP-CTERM/EpsH1 system associated)